MNNNYGTAGGVSVENNTITSTASSTILGATGNPNYSGIFLASLWSTVGTVSVSDNNISGNFNYGILAWNDALSVTVQGGTINASNMLAGVEMESDNYYGEVYTGGQGTLTVQNVAISAAPIGVYVYDNGNQGSYPFVKASVQNDTITGGGIAVEVNGLTATASISGNNIADNTTGIEFTGGGSGSVTGNDFNGADALPNPVADNSTDLLIDTTAGTVSIGDANQFYAANYYIQNLSTTPQNFDLSTDPNTTVSGVNLASLDPTTSVGLASLYSVEGKIVDYLDYPAEGYVRLQAGYDFVAASSETATPGAIQRGVNVANTDETSVPANGDIVEVQAGTYISNGNVANAGFGGVYGININKPLSLIGPNATFDPANSIVPAHGQAVILPGTNDPNVNDSNMFVLIGINSSDVTIKGLTLDGHNASLGSYTDPDSSVPGVVTSIDGQTINAASGIGSYGAFNDINVSANVLQHFSYDGIGLNSDGTSLAGNTISNNYIFGLSDDYHYGDGIDASNNLYANITDNVMNDVPDRRAAVQLLFGNSHRRHGQHLEQCYHREQERHLLQPVLPAGVGV